MARTIIGVMGPGNNPEEQDLQAAYELGKLIARREWVLLTGGRSAGVMEAASKGAREEGGLTVGILPGEDRKQMSEFVDIPILTGMGSARNNINVLSADVVVACGLGMGTTSEIMLALKANKHVILLNQTDEALGFLNSLESDLLHEASSVSDAMEKMERLL